MELERLHKLGIQISTSTLEAVAKGLVRVSITDRYYAEMRSGSHDKVVLNHTQKSWVYHFMERHSTAV